MAALLITERSRRRSSALTRSSPHPTDVVAEMGSVARRRAHCRPTPRRARLQDCLLPAAEGGAATRHVRSQRLGPERSSGKCRPSATSTMSAYAVSAAAAVGGPRVPGEWRPVAGAAVNPSRVSGSGPGPVPWRKAWRQHWPPAAGDPCAGFDPGQSRPLPCRHLGFRVCRRTVRALWWPGDLAPILPGCATSLPHRQRPPRPVPDRRGQPRPATTNAVSARGISCGRLAARHRASGAVTGLGRSAHGDMLIAGASAAPRCATCSSPCSKGRTGAARPIDRIPVTSTSVTNPRHTAQWPPRATKSATKRVRWDAPTRAGGMHGSGQCDSDERQTEMATDYDAPRKTDDEGAPE